MDELEQAISFFREYMKSGGNNSTTVIMTMNVIKTIYEALLFYQGYMIGALAREEERKRLMMNMNFNNPDDGPNPPPPKGEEYPPNNVCENH